ncbi:MAG: CRTAC1 family protein, partial [Planctomycetota bacterium]
AVIGVAFRRSLVVIAIAAGIGLLIWLWGQRPREAAPEKGLDAAAPEAVVEETSAPDLPFTDLTQAAGIDFVHFNGAYGDKLLPETMGGGVAFFDYDADDDPDLYVTCLGRNLLFRNEGKRFVLVEDGPDGGTWIEPETNKERHSWSTGAAWFDADNDGDLDLVVVNYVKWSEKTNVKAYIEDNELAYTRPQLYEGDRPRLYLQQDHGWFTDATEGSGLEGARDAKKIIPGKSMALCLDDYDGDGLVDLFVANDTVQNFLFLNRGNAKFEEVAVAAGVGYDDNGTARAAMGIDSFSFDNGDRVSVLIGNFSEEPVSFFTVARGGNEALLFRDDASRARVGQPTLLPLTFGLIVRDLDLDGYEDFVLANGHIEPSVSKLKAELQHKQSPQFFRNLQGRRFRDVSIDAGSGFQQRFVGRGLASADFDGDGDLDLVFTANAGRARLLRNDAPEGRVRVTVRVRQPKHKNREALGAVVHVGGQRRTIRTGGSYLSQSELIAVFGVEAESGPAHVVWPDGTKQEFTYRPGAQLIERK